jgi:hypothetical protein
LIDTSATGVLAGLTPAECTSKIEVDISGNVRVDINTAMVTPTEPAAGFVSPEIVDGFKRECAGTGEVWIDFLIPDSIPDGREYRIEFNDTSYFHNMGNPNYVIYDITGGQKVAKTDTIWIDGFSQSPMVDGFVANISDEECELNFDKTGWVVGSTNYRWRVNLDPRFTPSDPNDPANLNINYPASYEILFSDQIIDTAINKVGFPPTYPCKFSVYDLTANTDATFQFLDFNNDSTLSPYFPGQNVAKIEGMMIWVDDPDPENIYTLKTSWRFFFEADTTIGQLNPPAAGDIFHIVTKKSFRTGDHIDFTVRGKRYDPEKAKSDLDDIAVVPNPYVVTASWEPRSPYRFGRGERKIDFIHLPKKCTIRIYTLRGYLVDTIIHDSSLEDGSESWNLLSKDGRDIAYGVYIFHVDAEGVGEKISKFAVIK